MATPELLELLFASARGLLLSWDSPQSCTAFHTSSAVIPAICGVLLDSATSGAGEASPLGLAGDRGDGGVVAGARNAGGCSASGGSAFKLCCCLDKQRHFVGPGPVLCRQGGVTRLL